MSTMTYLISKYTCWVPSLCQEAVRRQEVCQTLTLEKQDVAWKGGRGLPLSLSRAKGGQGQFCVSKSWIGWPWNSLPILKNLWVYVWLVSKGPSKLCHFCSRGEPSFKGASIWAGSPHLKQGPIVSAASHQDKWTSKARGRRPSQF